MGVIQRLIVSKQMFNDIPTYCKKCGQKRTLKFFGFDGSYTWKCGCGCEIFKFHDADKDNVTCYFTRNFVSKKEYRKDYKNLDDFEKAGFKKMNGKYLK